MQFNKHLVQILVHTPDVTYRVQTFSNLIHTTPCKANTDRDNLQGSLEEHWTYYWSLSLLQLIQMNHLVYQLPLVVGEAALFYQLLLSLCKEYIRKQLKEDLFQ